jgi:hypothetical protein
VSWLDALLGRPKPIKASLDQMFGLSTAELTLETEFDLRPTGGAAICFRPVSTGDFTQLEGEINALLQASQKDSPLTWRSEKDSYGYEWMIVQAQEFENLVATIHMISRELEEAGYSDRLLASAFQFRDPAGANTYWLYNYKRGAFYPFVPAGKTGRDNAAELRLSSVMSKELNVEQDLTKWYPLWGIPLG